MNGGWKEGKYYRLKKNALSNLENFRFSKDPVLRFLYKNPYAVIKLKTIEEDFYGFLTRYSLGFKECNDDGKSQWPTYDFQGMLDIVENVSIQEELDV